MTGCCSGFPSSFDRSKERVRGKNFVRERLGSEGREGSYQLGKRNTKDVKIMQSILQCSSLGGSRMKRLISTMLSTWLSYEDVSGDLCR